MCYAIPGKVSQIGNKKATVDYFGEQKTAINEIEDLKIGDYIYAQGGYVIEKIPESKALEILSVWRETFFDLHDLDLRLSRLELEKNGIDRKLGQILDNAAEGLALKNSDLLYLLKLEKENELNLLFKASNFLRAKHLSNSCCVHGIIEFSNHCSQTCKYCGISIENKNIARYRMRKAEISDTAFDAINKMGFKALVLQSGEDPGYSVDDLCEIVRDIKSRSAALIFVSFGEVGIDGLKKIYDAGARGLLMRFETSNSELYTRIHPGCELKTRLGHIREAYKMGYLILTGGLIGLPGQTIEDQLNDILLTKELNAEMYSFGPFIPHPDSFLRDRHSPKPNDILKVLAVSRIIDPKNAKILVTTGFETVDKKAREIGLMAGANSVMLNVTPKKYKKLYSIYPNRAHENEELQEQIGTTLSLLKRLGRAPTDLGVSI
ncbi:[FeFe] hydrogenase H-cluster radical SAM maturase HydE [Candidatus Saganbacteria bacterium]|nr:[FeFe] hydrogenase H-cluster radical SAM maturase HydE [Candidatus Saganbacteria bacterium]